MAIFLLDICQRWVIKKFQLVPKVLRVVVKGREEPYITITIFIIKD